MVSQLGNHLESDKRKIQNRSFTMWLQFNASDINKGDGFSLL
jgi:hypothetical protein